MMQKESMKAKKVHITLTTTTTLDDEDRNNSRLAVNISKTRHNAVVDQERHGRI